MTIAVPQYPGSSFHMTHRDAVLPEPTASVETDYLGPGTNAGLFTFTTASLKPGPKPATLQFKDDNDPSAQFIVSIRAACEGT